MNVPNWQKHSKKPQKPTRRPQAMRDSRRRAKAMKAKFRAR